MALILVVAVCLFAALLARLWYLSVIEAPAAQKVASATDVKVVYTPAPRGNIYDRNGNLLAGNVNEPVITVERQAASTEPAMVQQLAPLLGMTTAQLDAAINNPTFSPYAYVPVVQEASAQEILYVEEHQSDFPDVRATTQAVRMYTPMGVAAANIIGYVGAINATELKSLQAQGYQPGDQIGQTGVEASFESVLRGTPGMERLQVSPAGQVLGVLSSTPPVQGANLYLTIDGNVQEVAQQAIEQGMSTAQAAFDKVTMRNFSAPGGSVVVEDPNTGQILALATWPSYDPNQFVGGISEANYAKLVNNPATPLENRPIQGQYAPGSTFKLITATAGLTYGLVTPTSPFDDTGFITIGSGSTAFTAHNDNDVAYGEIDLSQAITVSSDNYFNTIGIKLWDGRTTYGETALQNIANAYGLGSLTGIDIPGEEPGKIPTPASYAADHKANPTVFTQSEWFTGNSDQVAIGQDEDLVTPLQLANAYSAFANGGTLWTPQVALEESTQTGQLIQQYGTKKLRNTPALTSDERSAMLSGFEGVVQQQNGTAYADFAGTSLSGDDLAGKTGTAQVNPPRQDTSVFVGFGPATSPQYVVDAFMEDAGYGASDAGTVVREVFDQLLHQPLQPVQYLAASGNAT